MGNSGTVWIKHDFVLWLAPSSPCPVDSWLDLHFPLLPHPLFSQIQNSIRCLWATSQDGTPHRGTDWTSRWWWSWTEPSTLLLGKGSVPHARPPTIHCLNSYFTRHASCLRTSGSRTVIWVKSYFSLSSNHSLKIFWVCLTLCGFTKQ
jgi:hypothetical protein